MPPSRWRPAPRLAVDLGAPQCWCCPPKVTSEWVRVCCSRWYVVLNWTDICLSAGPSAPLHVQRSHMWVGLLLGLLVATIAGLLLTVAAQRREKETKFGYDLSVSCLVGLYVQRSCCRTHFQRFRSKLRMKTWHFSACLWCSSAFKAPGVESSVFFTAARSFSRIGADLQESTCECKVSYTSSVQNCYRFTDVTLKDVLICFRSKWVFSEIWILLVNFLLSNVKWLNHVFSLIQKPALILPLGI